MGMSKKQLQIIDTLDRRVSLCKEFMNDWLLFNQVMGHYTSPGADKAQLESQFLKIKSKLARGHKVLKEALAADYQIDGNAMNIVSGATNLESIYGQSEVSVKKLQNEWHRAFISINETLGVLEDKKARAEAGEKIYIPTSMAEGGGPVGGGETNKSLITVVIAIAVIGGLAALFFFTPLGAMWKDAIGM